MEGLSAICAGLCIIEEDDDGNQIGYSTDTYCLDNLKDLLRFLRRDDPQSREVFKQVCKWNIVGKDLIPIIEHFQDDRNLVLNAVKVLVFLTMPVEPTSHDIPQQIDYLWGLKSSITYSDTVPVIVSLLESPLENLEREAFTEDDWKLVQLVLTLFRNMLAIQDISPHQKAGGSATQFLSIRDKFLEQLFHENVMDLILVLTQHVGGSCGYLCHDNLLLLEIFHYLFMGQEPELIAKAFSKDLKVDGDANTSINSLKSIMEEEEKRKLTRLRNMSCCTQFSGTFTRLSMDGSKTLFKGNPCSASSETLLKSHKVNRGPRKKMAWDHGRLPSTKDSILVLLHDFVNQLLSGGYNVLMQSIRQDIEKEHHTIQSSDVIIFFHVAQFITSFQYHKTLYLKPKVEADSCEASANSQADNTLFKGNICGPIAATINESMFLLVISKWRYAYDGLKETKEYNFVSAAGSLMKIMIRMLDSVLKVSPEDSKEPQTARVLLYKLFYDQTDEGMTLFLLNQIKSFDTHKQAKSDLIDLVETIYVVIQLMENLQARGTLRVSRKPRKKKAKRKLNDKNDNVEHPIGDDVPIENVVGNLGCEPPPDSTVLSEKVIKTRSDGKDEDTGIPCQIDEPVTFELETHNQESHLPDVAKKASDEINDDISNGFGDSSSDEQQAATDEVDFKVSTLVSALANNAIIKNLCQMLKFYKSNSLRTNHYIISLLRKICEDLELSPMLYQLSLLNTFHMILDEQKSSPSKEYENIVTFLTNLVRRMMRKMKSQPLLFIEVLFWKTRKECHYINCESLMREVGHLKRESEKYGSVFKDEDFASTQGKGLGHRSIADALGDDEADFLYSHEIGKQKDEHPYNLKIQKESCEETGEKITSMANEGIHSNGNSDSKGTLELESKRLPKRRKRLVLDENLEGNIKNLYEKYKNDRHCSRLIAEELDPDVKVSPVQVSSKLRQLGLTVRPKNRMQQDGKSNHLREEEGTSRNESNLNFEKENSDFRPLQTKKRVRAFSEAQELTIKVLFEQFKNHKRCSHMIANALDADGKFTAAQVSRKLKQLGLHIPQRKRSKDNMHLMDEVHISHSAESAEDSDSETLLSLKKRSVNKKSERDAEVASNKKVERKLLEDNSNDETLSSIFGKTRRLLAAPKGVDLPATLVKHNITENNPGFRQDTQDVAERYGYEQLGETEANDLVDVTLNEISNTSSGKQVEGISVGDANNLPRQHMFYDLADQLSDYEDDVAPVASQGGAILRRKLRMVVDFEDDD